MTGDDFDLTAADIGPDDDGTLPTEPEVVEDSTGTDPASTGTGAESTAPVSGVLDELVDKAVTKRLAAEASAIAEAQSEEMLTPELYAALTVAARQKLAAAIDAEKAAGERAEAAAKGPYYPNAYRFFTDFLAPTYRRKTIHEPSMIWCPNWFEHVEAVSRVDALWRAWEHLRLDPSTGMSVWWRDHADHHMSKLLSPDGTFKDCVKTHRLIHELPTEEIPPRLVGTAVTDPPVS